MLGDVADQAEDLLALPLEVGGVEAGVLGAELDLDGLLDLGWELGEDGVLGAAAHQRGDAAAEGDKEAIDAAHRDLVRWLDRAVTRGALHKNTASRRKAQAAALVSSD